MKGLLGSTEIHRRRRRPTRSANARRPGSNIRPTVSRSVTGQPAEARAVRLYGLPFTDYPVRQPNGGNCFACHPADQGRGQLWHHRFDPAEAGKIRKFSEADTKAVYEKIYNAPVAIGARICPRFGTNKVSTIDQIKDLVALVMSTR